jgi:predicted enzyme related to lactoylglutathione lyase
MSETKQQEHRRIVREHYPESVTCWVDVDLPDAPAATEFYGGLFGWEFEDRMPEGQDGHYFVGLIDGLSVAGVGSQPEGSDWPPAWNTYVAVKSADEAAKAVEKAGGKVLMEAFDVGEAGRMAVVADPQGAAFNVWEAGSHMGAQVVNEHGSWNFSGLTTSDPYAAAGFYNEVFGWEAVSGSGEFTFFAVPGYGEFLQRSDPGLAERLQTDQAPPRFVDATAWLMGMEGQPDGTPPNWSVTFAVDDADAMAARAKELGGTVVVEPFDTPPVRTAVIADPQGAVFAVSKYTPPSG